MRGMGMGRLAREGSSTKASNPLKDFRRLIPWFLPYWKVIVFGVVCMAITTYISLQPPRIFQYVIDTIIGKHHYQQMIPTLLVLLGVFVGQALFGFLRTYVLHVAGQYLLNDIRIRLYAYFQKLPLTYYDNRQTGDLMSRMTGDIEQVGQLVEHGPDVFLMGFFSMVLTFYYLWTRSPELALFALIPIPVIAVSIFFFSRKIRTIYRGVRDRVGALNARLQDNFSGVRVIKAFSREAIEQGHVATESEAVMHMSIRGIRMWSSFGPAMGMVGNLGAVLVLGAGIVLTRQEHLTAGALMACWMFIGGFYQPVGTFFNFFDSIQRSLAAGERIFEVLDTEPEILDPEEPIALQAVRGEVEFQHVSFRYATGEEVLHNVSVHAHPGERVALVGRSGAGKSSFINLIPRFYDVRLGKVLVDGIDVRDVRQTELRQHIALVLQETFLFNGTVRDNLRYGRLDATDEEIEEAAKAANAHEFIVHLPKGYDTEIGERGVKLSGGQRQRLSIARAVLANPRILILDEATSSVDSESEFLIYQALERLMEGRTTFVIAHRLSTIKHADTILVLEDGEISEQGSHAELIRANGLYAQMYRQQFWLDELFKEEELEEAPKQAQDEDIDVPAIG